MGALRVTTQALAFCLEIAMLAAYAALALSAESALVGLALMTAVLAAVILVWGVFLAPKASRRIGYPWHVFAEAALMGGAAVALWLSGRGEAAGAFAVLVAIRFGLGFGLGIDREEALPER